MREGIATGRGESGPLDCQWMMVTPRRQCCYLFFFLICVGWTVHSVD